MDLQLAATLSLSEIVVWARLSGTPLQTSFSAILFQLLLYFAVQYSILKAYRLLIYPHFVSPLRHLPGPKDGYPILGQFPCILTAPSPNEPFLTWSAKWPQEPFVRYLGLGNEETLMINTPEAHKEVLHTHCYAFKKPDILFRFVGDILGMGLVFSEGAEHRRQRRILMGLFSVPNLKKIFPVFLEKAGRFTRWLDEGMDEDGRRIVDVTEAYLKVGLEITGPTVLGVEMDHLTGSDPKWNFEKCYRHIFKPTKMAGIVTLINTVIPIRRFLPIEANLSHIQAVDQARAMVTECARQRILDVDMAMEKGEKFDSIGLGSGGRDLLTLVVEERRRLKGSEDELAVEEVVDQILTFVVAGHETSVGILVWSSYILTKDQRIQNELRSEILAAITRNGGGDLSWEDIDRLQYLNNFVKEIVRLYAPAVISHRESTTDLTLCGTFVPKGTLFYFGMHIASHSAATWGDDAEQCVPERWDNLQGQAANPYAFQGFSQGPRICIGKNFALMNIKTFLVEMIVKFRFVKSPEIEALGDKEPPVQNPTFTLTPKGGMKVGFERI